jgi:hypothetical protein
MRFLHAAGADFCALNGNGHGALHKAAQRGKSAVCEWLLGHCGVEEGSCGGGGGGGGEGEGEGDSAAPTLESCHSQPDGEGFRPSALARLEDYTELAAWLLGQERILDGASSAASRH